MVGPHADNQRHGSPRSTNHQRFRSGLRDSRFIPTSPGEIKFVVSRTTEDVRQGGTASRAGVIEAVRFSAIVAVAAIVLMAVAQVWIGTCGASTYDALACGAPQLTLLALGAPLILLAGGLRAFIRAYQVSRSQAISWPWQGAGWVLMAAMLLVLAKSVLLIAIP